MARKQKSKKDPRKSFEEQLTLNEKALDRLTESISGLIRHVQRIAKNNLPLIRESLNEIIVNQEKDEMQIGRILDTLLDYAMLGIGQKEFRKLNFYYWSLNKRASNAYERDYRRAVEGK